MRGLNHQKEVAVDDLREVVRLNCTEVATLAQHKQEEGATMCYGRRDQRCGEGAMVHKRKAQLILKEAAIGPMRMVRPVLEEGTTIDVR